MSLTPDKARAVNYETIFALTGSRERSYRLLMALPDPDESLESAASALSETIGKGRDEIVDLHEKISHSFESEKINTKVLFPESPLFPEEKGEFFPVIYAAGDLSLLERKWVTFLGMPRPSMQGRHDAASAASVMLSEEIPVLLPLDDGLPAMTAELLLKNNGRIIGVVSGPISKCESETEARLRSRIYASGLLLSVFPPCQKTERWLVMIRNSFIASISASVFLAEEKDGGPSWSVFDKVLASGGRAMLSASMLEVPSYTWARKHIESGALTYSSEKDLKRIVPRTRNAERQPDLFS